MSGKGLAGILALGLAAAIAGPARAAGVERLYFPFHCYDENRQNWETVRRSNFPYPASKLTVVGYNCDERLVFIDWGQKNKKGEPIRCAVDRKKVDLSSTLSRYYCRRQGTECVGGRKPPPPPKHDDTFAGTLGFGHATICRGN
ncbi:MAG: hypothetical protein ACOC91_02095 [bacterium]